MRIVMRRLDSNLVGEDEGMKTASERGRQRHVTKAIALHWLCSLRSLLSSFFFSCLASALHGIACYGNGVSTYFSHLCRGPEMKVLRSGRIVLMMKTKIYS